MEAVECPPDASTSLMMDMEQHMEQRGSGSLPSAAGSAGTGEHSRSPAGQASQSPPADAQAPQVVLEGTQDYEQTGPKYKRGRGRSFFRDPPRRGAVCQVPGCDRSLHKLRDYYKRYKICPYHLELPSLVVEGQTIRFCQQCGRFQLLSDFEGDRRSCRTKLNKHNERRRKAEAEGKAAKALLRESGAFPLSEGDDMVFNGYGSGSRKVPRAAGPGGRYTGSNGQLGGVPGGPPLPPELNGMLQQLAGDPELQRALAPGVLQGLNDMAAGTAASNNDWLAGLAAVATAGLPPAPAPTPPQNGSPLMDPALLSLLPSLSTLTSQALNGGGQLGDVLLQAYVQEQQQRQQAQQAAHPHTQLDTLNGHWQLPGMSMQAQAQAQPPQPAVHPQPQRGGLAALTSLLGSMQQQPQQPAAPPMLGNGSAFTPVSRPPSLPTPAPPLQQHAANGDDSAALLAQLASNPGLMPADVLEALARTSGPASVHEQQHAASPEDAAPAHLVALAQQLAAVQTGSTGAMSSAGQPVKASPSEVLMGDVPHAFTSAGLAAAQGLPRGIIQDAGLMAIKQEHQLSNGLEPGTAHAMPALPRLPSDLLSQQQPRVALPQQLDLGALRQAVTGNGLSPAFAHEALALLQQLAQAAAAPPSARERVHHLSIKLFQCTPDQLPLTLLRELETWLARDPTFLEGSARPGCVHLHFAALVSEQEQVRLVTDFSHLLQILVDGGALGPAATAGGVLAQQGSQAAVLEQGRVLMSINCGQQPEALPRLFSVRPLAVTPTYSGPILATGRHISEAQDAIFCRRQGTYPLTEVVGKGQEVRLSADDVVPLEWVQLRLPVLAPGAYQVEAQRGLLCSEPATFLVVEDAEAAMELRRLETSPMGIANVPEFIHKVGIVLQHQRQYSRDGGADGSTPALAPETLHRIVRTAHEVAAACVVRGWPALLRTVLPVVMADCSAAQAVEGMQAHVGKVPLLHAAVVTGAARVLRELGAWSEAVGYSWCLDGATSLGLTPLHFAAMLHEPEDTALALTRLSPAGHKLWAAATSRCGVTPLEVAAKLGKRGLLQALAEAGSASAAQALAGMDRPDGLQAAGSAAPAVPMSAGAALASQLAGTDDASSAESSPKKEARKLSSFGSSSGTESPSSVLDGFPSSLAPDAEDEQLLCKPGRAPLTPGPCASACSPSCFPGSHAGQAQHKQHRLCMLDWAVYSLLALFHFLLAGLASNASRGSSWQYAALGMVAALPALALQPKLLSSSAGWRWAYAKYREVIVVVVQLGMLAVQHLLFRAHGAGWLLSSGCPSLAQPVLLFASSLALQLPFAFLAPLLLASFAANVALLSSACPQRELRCMSQALLYLGLVGVAAPLLGVRLMCLRGRQHPWHRRPALAA